MALAVLLGAALFVVARPVRAELDLSWEAPPNCPQRDEVLERIRALAGSALDETAGLSLEGTIAKASGRYQLTLLVRAGDDARKRVIASDSCADLAGAAAVTVALLLGVDATALDAGSSDARAADPNAAKADASKQSAPNEDGRSRKPPQPSPAAAPAPPAESPPSSESPSPWAFLARAPTGSVDFGPLPRPALTVGLGVGVRYDAWRIVLAGRLGKTQTVDAPDSGGAFGAELDRITGELSTCRGFRVSPFELAPCVVLALEHVKARGYGDGISSMSERTTWPGLGAGAVAHWYALESLAFFTGVSGTVQLSRPRIVIEGAGEVARLAPIAISTTFGAEWIL